ncbi:polysaccharide pyruvyl transferase family protein [Algibacter lectus]|uniref:polysaccharide pyruvyl transferase family protein n=1 Tax=Algibacter lectus TaxID=221126 RepID=UPI0026F21F2C|nr:polysaccharide pyruvyl transferase family protein [Algibacter lectus]MDO7136431.1 polysaccharide pyruvyl transferase family protein [Algibacter lectus]
MKIKTITCHEVYNHGASLQEYALLKHLENEGHEAETIHYKPEYLSNHFKFWRIANPRYEKNIFLKLAYLIIKFPFRYKRLKRKKSFDNFSKYYIKSTQKLYRNNEELKHDLPIADAYICGSDQIWNSFFPNGKDPAFYLDFVPSDKLKISYAASFAIDKLDLDIKEFVKEKISRINHISVRESSGKNIIQDLGILKKITNVLDPVFLIKKQDWKKLCTDLEIKEKYIFVYDFESNPTIEKFVKDQASRKGYKIVSVNSNIKYSDYNFYLNGPSTFLSLIKNADFIVSNSFHAVAFSVIFNKQFVVFNRAEKINTRMRDFTSLLEISDVLIKGNTDLMDYKYVIDYELLNKKLSSLIKVSKTFLTNSLKTSYDS